MRSNLRNFLARRVNKSKNRAAKSFVEVECDSITLYAQRVSEIIPKSESDYRSSGFVLKSSVERCLQLISDKQINILYALYSGTLRINGDYEALLRSSKFFDSALLQKVKSRKSLRNNLVHNYVEGEFDSEVFEHASDLSDVAEFVARAKELSDSRR